MTAKEGGWVALSKTTSFLNGCSGCRIRETFVRLHHNDNALSVFALKNFL